MKIGLLGTAHTFHQAPFGDTSWELWACNLGDVPRWDRWFQLHNDAVIDGNPGHAQWLAAQGKPVYLAKPRRDIPNALVYPLGEMVAEFGTWFFTSSIAFMAALALKEFEAKPDEEHELGLWGVEMAHDSEYAAQKPGVQFFLQIASMRGVRLVMPPECELLVPGTLYGVEEPSWIEMKSGARLAELRHRMAELEAMKNGLILRKTALMGRRDIVLSPEEIEKHLADTNEKLAQAEQDGLRLDGAIQNMEHVAVNWRRPAPQGSSA